MCVFTNKLYVTEGGTRLSTLPLGNKDIIGMNNRTNEVQLKERSGL